MDRARPLSESPDAAAPQESGESVASRRRRLGLRERRGQGYEPDLRQQQHTPAGSPPLLEIRPKKAAFQQINAGVTSSESAADARPASLDGKRLNLAGSSSRPEGRSPAVVAGAAAALGRPAPSSARAAPDAAVAPLRLLITGDEDINEREFKQSLRMRASVDYIHPTVMGMLPGGSGAPQQRGKSKPDLGSVGEAQPSTEAAARSVDPNLTLEDEATSAAAEASATLNAPVSGGSLGLPHGAARARAEAAGVGSMQSTDVASKRGDDSPAAIPAATAPNNPPSTMLSRMMRRPAPKP